MKSNKLLDKILWKGKNKWQMLGAAIGSFIGFFLLLATFQFYLDIQRLLSGDANPSDQYVQVNKKVNLFNSLGVKSGFSTTELAEIKSKPFVVDLGAFTSNEFKAGAYSDMLGFYTELFFEAVPEPFLDFREPEFRWSEGQNTLPIILSKDYLALYNFGFAPSQGLPQVTPSTIGKLSFEIRISGKGKNQSFNGKVVGFSSRINSILAPQSFVEWANNNFGDNPSQPSRLILKVENPLNKDFQAFLKEKGYEVSSGKLIGSQFGFLLKLVLGIVWGMGLLILALSMLIFALNFQLLISQSKPEIKLLLETGHFPIQISGLLAKRFSIVFGAILSAVFLSLLITRNLQVDYFSEQGFELSASLDFLVLVAAAAFSAILLLLNIMNIKKAVMNQS